MNPIPPEELKEKIRKKEIKIAVVGLGYVGLPLAVEFARSGIEVLGIDIDKDRIGHLKRKESYITDISQKELRQVLVKAKLRAFGDFSPIKKVDVVVICVPTPLKRKYYPDISYIKQAVKSISKYIKRGSLVILESTTYPGTTEEIILPLLERDDFRHNRDFWLAFSPERIDPGNKDYPIHKITKIVGGVSKEATTLAVLVYANIIEKIVSVSSARVAEAVKLLENTFRLINIAMIDELAMMAHKMNVDIWEVIKAAATKPFGFMPFYPGPGVGGHCIGKDPLYLYWKAKHFGFYSRFIKLASDITNYMPEYVTERVIGLLGSRRVNILVVGVTYKKDVKDLRKSPALDIIDIFQKKKIRVSYYDPLIPYLRFDHSNLKSIPLEAKRLKLFDCVVIAADHSCLDYDFILKHAQLVFDTRNVYRGVLSRKIVRL